MFIYKKIIIKTHGKMATTVLDLGISGHSAILCVRLYTAYLDKE